MMGLRSRSSVFAMTAPTTTNDEIQDPSTPGNNPDPTAVDFVIVPGADGEQWLSEPLGDRPGSPDPVDPVTNLQVNGTPTTTSISYSWSYSGSNHTRFEVDIYIDNGASPSWSRVASLGTTARSYTATNLPPNTRIGMRVRAANDE